MSTRFNSLMKNQSQKEEESKATKKRNSKQQRKQKTFTNVNNVKWSEKV